MTKTITITATKIALVVSTSVLFLILAAFGGYLLSDHLWSGRSCDEECEQLSATKLAKFDLGKITFCELSEDERFTVCPHYRLFEKFDDGGTVITYICNYKNAYAEISNLGIESRAKIEQKLEYFRESTDIKVHCTTKKGLVYKIVQKSQETL